MPEKTIERLDRLVKQIKKGYEVKKEEKEKGKKSEKE
jgi:hypothetical protein